MDFFQQIAMAIVVLGGLGAVLFFAKQRGLAQFSIRTAKPGAPKRMLLLERLPLSATHSLHLVSIDGRPILVAVSPGGCQLLRRSEGDHAA